MREINYSVTQNGITPESSICAGIQGEDNATRIIFTLDSSLLNKQYLLNITDGSGRFYSSDFLTLLEDKIYFDIPAALSSVGGVCTLHLVIKNEAENRTLFSYPAVLWFEPSAENTLSAKLYLKDIADALKACKNAELNVNETAVDFKEKSAAAKEEFNNIKNQAEAFSKEAENFAKLAKENSFIKNGQIDPEKTNFFNFESYNRFNQSDVSKNTYVNQSGVETPIDNYNMTGYIYVKGHNKVLIGGDGFELQSTRNIGAACFYGERRENEFLSRVSQAYGSGYDIPEGACYCRIQYLNSGNIIMSDGKYHPLNQINLDEWHDYDDFKLTLKNEYFPLKKYNIKNLVTFGDSHVSKNLWQQDVLDYFGIKQHTNLGVASSTVAENAGSSYTPFIDNSRINAIKTANPDTIIILGGSNDVHLDTPLGTTEELTKGILDKNKTTFIGAYSFLIETLLTWKPSLNIIVCTVPQGIYDETHTTKYHEISNTIKNIANYYSLPIADIFGKCGINKKNISNFSSDNMHYNANGCKRIASLIIKTINESYIG